MKKTNPKTKSTVSARKLRAASKNKFVAFDIKDILVLIGIVVFGFILYSNTFNSSFHFDDLDNLQENPIIRSLSNVQSIWEYSHTRFLAYYSFALNYHFSQLDVTGYHILNILIHGITAWLVYWLAVLIFSSPVLKDKPIAKDKKVVALAAALLFVAHPLATQSVTYIIQRMSSMAAMFYLLSIAMYMMGRYTQPEQSKKYLYFAGCAVAAIGAMLTKENAFTLPFAILLVEVFFLQPPGRSISFKDYRVILLGVVLLLFVAVGYFKFASFVHTSFKIHSDVADRTLSASNYLYTQFSVILKYIQLLLVPARLNLDYDYKLVYHFTDPRSITSFFMLLAILALGVILFKKQRIFSFGIFWFFLTLSIESSIIPLQDVIFEHRTYLPSFGFFLCMSYGIYLLTWEHYKKVGIAAVALFVVVYGVLTFERNKVWENEITLWTDVIEKSPHKARCYNNRGDDFMEEGKLSEAMDDFNKALEIYPGFAMAYYNRANVYKKQEKFQESIADYTKAIELWPDLHKAYSNRGNIYKMINRLEEAVTDYSYAIKLDPNYFMAYNNRASVYIMQHKIPEAIQDLNQSISLNPQCAECFGNRGLAEMSQGNRQMGCMDLQQAVNLGFKPAAEVLAQNCR